MGKPELLCPSQPNQTHFIIVFIYLFQTKDTILFPIPFLRSKMWNSEPHQTITHLHTWNYLCPFHYYVIVAYSLRNYKLNIMVRTHSIFTNGFLKCISKWKSSLKILSTKMKILIRDGLIVYIISVISKINFYVIAGFYWEYV